jgi:hypothetical protein
VQHRGQQQAAHDEGVEEDRRCQAEAEQLYPAVVAEDERQEDADHDRRRRGNHAPGDGQALADGAARVAPPRPLLVDARDEEDLVVHR